MRDPDVIIGTPDRPYIRRWWQIPRNHWFNVYLHNICRSDDDRALHDHPWWNLSIILRGGYVEVTAKGRRIRRAGDFVLRSASTAHRLEIISDIPCWSLFITGPHIRDWGFHCPKGWVPWREFVAEGSPGEIGPGCGDPA